MEPLLGTIFAFAGNFVPHGYKECNGELLPISEYSGLYAILGTQYGGDGETSFALPDLRDKSPAGIGGISYIIGIDGNYCSRY